MKASIQTRTAPATGSTFHELVAEDAKGSFILATAGGRKPPRFMTTAVDFLNHRLHYLSAETVAERFTTRKVRGEIRFSLSEEER